LLERAVSQILFLIVIYLMRPVPAATRATSLPPIWSCSGWGLPCRRHCCRRGGLLPRRFTLTRECSSAEVSKCWSPRPRHLPT